MKRVVVLLLLFVLTFGLFSCKKAKPAEDVFYTVEFNTLSLPVESTAPAALSVKEGEVVTKPEFSAPATAGYVVVWTKDPLTKVVYDFSSPVTESFVLYAVEIPKNYSIIYLTERGANDSRNPTTYSKATETFSLYEPVMPFGYRFIKWAYFDDPESAVVCVEKGTEGDIVLRAVMKAVTYDVKYVDGGDVNPNPTTYLFGTELSLESPSKEGYRFLGYTITDDRNNTPVTALDPTFVEANRVTLFYENGVTISLKANWEKIA